MRDQHRHARAAIGGECTAGVEAEPAHPQHRGAGHDHAWTMRWPKFVRKAAPAAQTFDDDDRGDAGRGMHHQPAGEIHHAHLSEPATAPNPVTHRRIDDDEPKTADEQHRREPHPLGIGADDQRRRDNRKGHLEHKEDAFRNIAGQRIDSDTRQKHFAKPANPLVCGAAIGKSEAVHAHHPEHRGEAGDCKAMHEHRQDVLRPHEAAIKQGQPRQCHEEDKRRRRQNPGCIGAA